MQGYDHSFAVMMIRGLGLSLGMLAIFGAVNFIRRLTGRSDK